MDVLWSIAGSTAILSIGFIFGLIYSKLSTSASSKHGVIDTVARAARVAAIRAETMEATHKMVFVVRTDLGMGKGKIAAQCSHAAVACHQKALMTDVDNHDRWEARGRPKICLRGEGDENSLFDLQRKAEDNKIVTALIRDAGRTQVDPGTYTVLGIGPASYAEINKITGHLKLL